MVLAQMIHKGLPGEDVGKPSIRREISGLKPRGMRTGRSPMITRTCHFWKPAYTSDTMVARQDDVVMKPLFGENGDERGRQV